MGEEREQSSGSGSGMLGTQSPSSPAPGILMEGFDQARQHPRRKRKAESQDNERLSKRLSLLNIGECG